MRAEQSVTVWGGSYGSGYLVGPRLVLTAAHVVAGAGPGGAAQIVRADESEWWACEVAWLGNGSAGMDAALLRVHDPRWVPPARLAPPRWGRFTTGEPGQRWQAVGFPDAVEAVGGLRESEHLSGTVNPGSRTRARRLACAIQGPAPTGRGPSPWSGFSGAALFASGLLIGVALIDATAWQHGRIEALPAERLLAEPGFRTLWEEEWEHAAVPESVELAGLVVPPSAKRPVSPAGLLRADADVLPFHGREELLAGLHDWCVQDDPDGTGVSLRLLTAPGGHGKSRTARELAARLRTEGWAAGELTAWGPAHRADRPYAAVAAGTVPVLLVIDYAESRSEQITALVRALDHRHGGAPVRLLLLARSAGEWWDTLRTADPLLDDLTRSPVHHVLEPLFDGPAAPGPELETSLLALARALGRLPGHRDTDWGRLIPDATALAHDLLADGPVSALDLHLAALTALLQTGPRPVAPPGTHPATAAREPETAEDILLAHEERYWLTGARAHGVALSPAVLRRAVAFACLTAPPDEATARDVLRCVPGLRDLGEDAGITAATWLRDIYPPLGSAFWGSLQPDRIAEHLLGHVLGDRPELLRSALPELPRDLLDHALTVLARTWARRPSFAEECAEAIAASPARLLPAAVRQVTSTLEPAPVRRALERYLSQESLETSTLATVLMAVPLKTEVLHAPAVHMAQLLARHLLGELRSGQPVLEETAVALNIAAIRQQSLTGHAGSEERALAELAVAVNRALVEQHGSGQRKHLGMALALRTRCLDRPGEEQAALACADEAVGLLRDLPGAEWDLVTALNSRAVVLGRCGKHETVLDVVDEALLILGNQAVPGTDGDMLFFTLRQNQVLSLAALGRLTEALDTSSQTLARFREHAERRPDAWAELCCLALRQHAEILLDSGRPEAARPVLDEALGHARRLVRSRPGAHHALLSSLLVFTASVQDATGSAAEAAETVGEAVGLLRRAAPDDPSVAGQLADTLGLHSVLLAEAGEPRRALRAANGAVQIRRDLYRAEPDGRYRHLADALLVLERRFTALGLPHRAESAASDAVGVLRAHGDPGDAGTAERLADALHRRANRRTDTGNAAGGRSDIAESVRLRRSLVRRSPSLPHRRDLGVSLLDEGAKYLPRRPKRALRSADEAVGLLRGVAEAGHEGGDVDLARALGNRAGVLAALERTEAALRDSEETVALFRAAVEARSSEDGGVDSGPVEDLAIALTNHAHMLLSTGAAEEAMRAAEEAVGRYHASLARTGAVGRGALMVLSLVALGKAAREAGYEARAESALETARAFARRTGQPGLVRAYLGGRPGDG
ncbi:trypsin-like peptidase domain-containing protein [Streptomyces albus subsp. chlorinus]|uniref:S1 family peptidase n=1 Tax=Streptomyces albus TaxID=1888 RepID=UPI00156E015D|nr:serine protease [Streptomyces albus]NSC25291.1 trypsin-like peptidase domain-containing protein [Streptomyces albus subsp. chlorinus]